MDKTVFDWLTQRSDVGGPRVELSRRTALDRWRGVQQADCSDALASSADADHHSLHGNNLEPGKDCRFTARRFR